MMHVTYLLISASLAECYSLCFHEQRRRLMRSQGKACVHVRYCERVSRGGKHGEDREVALGLLRSAGTCLRVAGEKIICTTVQSPIGTCLLEGIPV